ncbi:MAG TPA: cysteine peptidase family C39 domain-containing protein, partial [Gammaproteobacteria bacterium]|nr:cysteine peptidase family C39 domain-containing protein [Gammaproteobacteria bacterium]
MAKKPFTSETSIRKGVGEPPSEQNLEEKTSEVREAEPFQIEAVAEKESQQSKKQSGSKAEVIQSATLSPQKNQSKAAPPSWEIPAVHHANYDPLLGCLVILTRMEHNPFSPETLIAGLPLVDNKLTPELFVRASARAGLSAQIVRRELDEISTLVMPAVILLKNRQACVIIDKDEEKKIYQIIQPESGEGQVAIPFEKLEEDYTGYSIFTRPTHRFDARTDKSMTERPKSWFWGVVAYTWPLYTEIIVASFFINCFAIASSLFVMNVYDRVVPNNAIDTLTVLAVGVLTVFCFDFMMRMFRGYFIDIAAKKTDVILSANIF